MREFNERRRFFNEKKFIGIILFVLIAVAAFTFIVMNLWNSILVPVLHVGIITFWQALGIFVLSKILFGGFRGGRGGWRGHSRFSEWKGEGFEKRKEMFEKFQKMTPEEREQFKQSWRGRCAPWQRNQATQNTQPASSTEQ